MTESDRLRVLVLCTGNSARSQIAEALLVRHGGARVAVRSAGSSPATRVHPDAVAVLNDHGIEWAGKSPKSLADVEGEYDLVITVCDNARDACPHYPHARAQVHWGLPDPADISDRAEQQRSFAQTFDVLDRSIRNLLALPLEKLSRDQLVDQATSAFAGEKHT